MTDEEGYQWGVVYYGRDVGYIAYDTEMEARHEAQNVDDKYAPARLVRRVIGPIEFVDGSGICAYVLPYRSRNYKCSQPSGHDGDHRFVFPA